MRIRHERGLFLFVPAKEELNNVEFGFRLSVSPAVAEFLPVFTYCGDNRCAWEAIYSASSPSSKSSSAVSTSWTSSLVQMAAISLVPAGGRDQGRWREDLGTWCGGCNFQLFKGLLYNRMGLYCSLMV